MGVLFLCVAASLQIVNQNEMSRRMAREALDNSRLLALPPSSLRWDAVLLIADAQSWSISETPGSLLPFAFSAQDKSIQENMLFKSN